ncbi:hypothetical protein GCM10022226_33880 [Sphaerisporangium flaviroseum]|uniref:Peptidase C51 domain-containing protein n=1 Tax=Sphaerisporangium flaviroseum TaxID=509199 RepID=A0ABP7I675_9ACTN
MSPELQKMLDLLQTQLGYSEQGGGYTKFGAWYGKTVEFDSDYSAQPWCDMFLSWAAHQLGYEKWFGQFAYTVNHAEWFVDHGAWGTTPKPGAVVFFDWGGSDVVDNIDHVGMVVSVDGQTIHTIEGNVDGRFVREKVRDQSYVVGYGYPEKVKAKLSEVTVVTKASFAGPQAGAAPAVLAGTRSAQDAPAAEPIVPAMTLAAAESSIPATVTMGMPAANGIAGGVASQQADLGAGALVAPVLIASLVLIAYFKVTHASVRLALSIARRGQDRQSVTAGSRTPYRSANSASFATASRPRVQGRTIMRSTPSLSQPPTSSGPVNE